MKKLPNKRFATEEYVPRSVEWSNLIDAITELQHRVEYLDHFQEKMAKELKPLWIREKLKQADEAIKSEAVKKQEAHTISQLRSLAVSYTGPMMFKGLTEVERFLDYLEEQEKGEK